MRVGITSVAFVLKMNARSVHIIGFYFLYFSGKYCRYFEARRKLASFI